MRNSDPDSRLKSFQAEQSETDERHARIMEELQTRQRIRNVWVHLEGCDKVELTPDRLARWLVTLAEVLAGFEWQGVPENVKPNTDIQKETLHLLDLASNAQERGQLIETVAERLRALSQIERTWGRLLRCLKTWLPAVVLGEEPPLEIPPVPPDGWEGSYPKPVEDLPSFCEWLDSVIHRQDHLLPLTTLGREVQQGPSTGRAIRNAYRLIDKLGILAEMPRQPEGPFTVAQETAKLRKLKRVALRLSRQKFSKRSEAGTKGGVGEQGVGKEVEPAHSSSQPHGRQPPELNPEARAILAKARAKKAMAVEAQRTSADQEARLRRAIDAWGQLGQSRGGVVLDDLASRDSQLRHYAALIVELGQRLKTDAWESRVDSVSPGPQAKAMALEILRQGMAANQEAVLELLQGCADTLFQLGFDVDYWLRHGLRDEVLGIRPPPVPPSGWEGPYLEPVQTPSDLIRWIDLEFDVEAIVGRGHGNQPSDGHLVRNAYRLVDQLNLTGMPLEPPGPFTLNMELAALRNLRRLCVPLTEQKEEEHAERKTTRRRKRGRPSDTDPKTDRKIREAWETKGYKNLEELAAAFHTTKHKAKCALDRERHRQKKRTG